MALVVFDMGRRVETPFQPMRNRVTATTAIRATGRIDQTTAQVPNDAAYALNAYLSQEQKEPDNVAIIHEIMHREVRTLAADTSVAEAWDIIQQTGFHHFPIIDAERHVLAMFSDYDLLHALVKRPASTLASFWKTNVMGIAIRPVLCVLENTDIRQASNLMYEYNIDALPVLNNYNALCGIITRSDILKLISHYGPMELWA